MIFEHASIYQKWNAFGGYIFRELTTMSGENIFKWATKGCPTAFYHLRWQ